MRVFHGSDTYIDVIHLERCKPNKDFSYKAFKERGIKEGWWIWG